MSAPHAGMQLKSGMELQRDHYTYNDDVLNLFRNIREMDSYDEMSDAEKLFIEDVDYHLQNLMDETRSAFFE